MEEVTQINVLYNSLYVERSLGDMDGKRVVACISASVTCGGVSFKVTFSCVQSGIVAKDYRWQIINSSRVSPGLPVPLGTAVFIWLTCPSFFQSFSAPNGTTPAQKL